MSLVKIKNNFEMPIEGYKIHTISFNGFIEIIFQDKIKDEWIYKLEIEGDYKIEIYGQIFQFSPTNKEGYKMLIDFLQETIKVCKADKNGYFYLETQKGNSIQIEDSPYENWHFRIYKQSIKYERQSDVTGGVGQTSIYQNKL
ncbi:hypothetical protein ACE193_05365 [Bernardetia sp. OM2101]|uniref:hypothetical protein n=1 Tax=Bernardetia sp. OM2101 TaxID=3344876 RepID=UPI0035CFBFB0